MAGLETPAFRRIGEPQTGYRLGALPHFAFGDLAVLQ